MPPCSGRQQPVKLNKKALLSTGIAKMHHADWLTSGYDQRSEGTTIPFKLRTQMHDVFIKQHNCFNDTDKHNQAQRKKINSNILNQHIALETLLNAGLPIATEIHERHTSQIIFGFSTGSIYKIQYSVSHKREAS
jgi:phage-related tail protein